eukprot:m.486724 g.486724  ORF g.486724 m.486724 type:complete len:140 (+) comp24569_c0_seq1:359-778(+)
MACGDRPTVSIPTDPEELQQFSDVTITVTECALMDTRVEASDFQVAGVVDGQPFFRNAANVLLWWWPLRTGDGGHWVISPNGNTGGWYWSQRCEDVQLPPDGKWEESRALTSDYNGCNGKPYPRVTVNDVLVKSAAKTC